MITNRSFLHATSHLWNNLSPTLHVPYQSGTSSSPSSSPSSCSDPWPLVDISHSVFHSHLKSFLFSKSFHLSLAHVHLLEFDHSLFGSHWRYCCWLWQIKPVQLAFSTHCTVVILTKILNNKPNFCQFYCDHLHILWVTFNNPPCRRSNAALIKVLIVSYLSVNLACYAPNTLYNTNQN